MNTNATIKLTANFDKDNYTEQEFYALIQFLSQNENNANMFWIRKPHQAIPYTLVSIEQAYYDDNFFGLQINNNITP